MSSALPALYGSVYTIDGLNFGGAPGADGVELVLSALTGWDGSAPPVTQHVQRPGSSGEFDLPVQAGARAIGGTGWLWVPTSLSLNAGITLRRQYEDKLAAMCGGNSLHIFLDTREDGTTRQAYVRLDAVTEVQVDSGNPYASDFTFQLSAADHRKYGAVVTSVVTLPTSSGGLDFATGGGLNFSPGLNFGTAGTSGTAPVSNPGTADTYPVITFSAAGGSVTNPVVTDTSTGKQLAFTGLTLSGTDQLVITQNPTLRSVLLNGTGDRRGSMSVANWITIAAGATDTLQFGASASTGTPTMTVAVAPAYR
jgi:hypothetical protein